MAANSSDLFKKTGASTVTTLSAPGKALSATSITVGSTTNYPTDTGIVIAIRIVDSSGQLVAGTYTEWSATVTSPTTLGIEAVPVYGSDQVYPAGSTTQVYIPLSSYAHNKLVDGILEEHNQDGTHGDITADSIVSTGTIEAASFVTTGGGSDQGWNTGLPVPNTIVDNGNRSYTWTYTGVDVTDTISPGMRIRGTRTTTAPTQCTDLESSSSQYWQDTTVSGHSFTDDFVAGAWVRLESYTGSVQTIISQYNGTSGWLLYLTTSGQVALQGNNGGGSNLSSVTSYQSIPLNKWVHISAQLDMSAFTATTTTSYVMIDSVDVPASVARSGTNPVLFARAGNLQVGAASSGSFFDGKIAQAFVSSAKITQANVRVIKNQGLTPALITSNSIASAYDFNGNANDLNTTSANNLVASGGAGYVSDSPFSLGSELASGFTDGTTDFGIVMSATFSTNSTVIVQAPEGCTFPTSGTLSAVYYSSLDTPYGFPRESTKFEVEMIAGSNGSQGSPANGTWYNLGNYLSVPIGKWRGSYEYSVQPVKGSVGIDFWATLSTGASTESDIRYTHYEYHGNDSNVVTLARLLPTKLETTTMTPYYFNVKSASTLTSLTARTVSGRGCITVVPAYV